jgi:hypothetical protein
MDDKLVNSTKLFAVSQKMFDRESAEFERNKASVASRLNDLERAAGTLVEQAQTQVSQTTQWMGRVAEMFDGLEARVRIQEKASAAAVSDRARLEALESELAKYVVRC